MDTGTIVMVCAIAFALSFIVSYVVLTFISGRWQ